MSLTRYCKKQFQSYELGKGACFDSGGHKYKAIPSTYREVYNRYLAGEVGSNHHIDFAIRKGKDVAIHMTKSKM